MSDNLYQPPQANLTAHDDDHARDVAIRERHIAHEASVRSVGLLYYVAGIALVLGGLAMAFGALDSAGQEFGLALGIAVLYLGLGASMLWTGGALRALRNSARIPATLFSVVGLFGFPIGTLINGYILWLIHCAKGRMVMSAQYREVRSRTPEIKYRTSTIIWTCLVFFLLALAAAVVIPMLR